jgi:ribonuclease HII
MAKGRVKPPSPSPLSRAGELYAFDRNVQLRFIAGLPLDEDSLLATKEGEKAIPSLGFPAIAGLDEAGRGALAGPVVVACVHFPKFVPPPAEKGEKEDWIGLLSYLDDSKRLTPNRREALFERITELSHWGVGVAPAEEIDRYGIVCASSLAARRAYQSMGDRVALLLLDRGLSLATTLPKNGAPKTALDSPSSSRELSLTRGDARSFHIAAASVLAKVVRDRMMVALALDPRFPAYGFPKNKGYGTAGHLAALRRYGPSPIHRRSYRLPLGKPGHTGTGY